MFLFTFRRTILERRQFIDRFGKEIPTIRIDKRYNKCLCIVMERLEVCDVCGELVGLNVTNTDLIDATIENHGDIFIAAVRIGDASGERNAMKKTEVLKKSKRGF